MGRILTDSEVFGTAPRGQVLSDEDVFGASAPKPIGPPEELSFGDRLMSGVELPAWMRALSEGRDALRGTAVEGVSRGMLAPFVGTVQAGANLLGQGGAVNAEVDASERRYQEDRAAQGREGFDAAEFAGQVASPFNAVLAARGLGAGLRGWQAAKTGGILGGAAAAAQPVVGAEGLGDFLRSKAGQAGAGVATGAVLAPALGAVANRAVRWLKDSPEIVGARASVHADGAIKAALKETGQTVDDIPAGQMAALRAEVVSAMRGGKKLDAAAALRKTDFDELGIQPTLGQITRDPNIYAKEKNLQSIGDVGAELTKRFSGQNARLSEIVSKPAAGAKDFVTAGEKISAALKETDDVLRRHVSGLYASARKSAGSDLDVPLRGLAQDYAAVLDDFGDKIPSAIRSKFSALGLDPLNPSNQKKIFTLDDADKLHKVINEHVGIDKATNTALGKLRKGLRLAVEQADPSGGPFAPAVKAAKERFILHDAVPALKAAAEDGVSADKFVNKFIVNGSTKEVKELANVLKSANPEAWGEARAQLAETLRRAAFGDNTAGDAPFAAARYMATIRRLGPHKLSAFFNAKEVEDILRVGRVGAFMRSYPSDAPVNTSRSAGALTWMASKIPGGNALASLGQAAGRTIKGSADAKRSLAAQVPVTAADLTQRQRNVLALILSGGAIAGGAASGSALR